ncbi:MULTISPECIES: efflux RND transporter periplasmic adaptor subunit [unclassified Janthinobacterium]|uniref:efflux RND transporter periplasmic adaptor subunit n=1 Tax=unclassified Janthinobacterium TaxID=2610881 RepID=UPI001618A8F2|nr:MULTISPECIES: efflux RND transporter periplasmic adaptor subunit [unclassified Janthinobacterium]MBB5610191.1 cobalt-zinc-cadmium efflux system membrane fusion protein [Janthinobacterium sp. S3T4]MBB5615559.1 cobalt-zinc-cadmium efflux system membrane fusion protein [Janthinobacterium sp. S3M3]
MISRSTLTYGSLFVLLCGGAVAGVQYMQRAHAASQASSSAAKPASATPGVLHFAANAPQLSTLKIAAVSAVPLPASAALNGRIAYDENVTTRVSSPVLGRVLALHADSGDKVARGALLADLDSPDLASAEADWRKAQADELRKHLAFQRAETLFKGEVLARKDYESADADFQQAHAETRRAALRMQSLNAAGSDNGRYALRAPLAGIIADRQINPGQEVRPDAPGPLFVISDLRRLWVLVDVPESAVASVHEGQLVSIETDAYPGRRFSARVAHIAPVLDPLTRRIQVRCTLDNADGQLKPEMFARASFLAGDGASLAVELPNTSLFAEGMYSYAFVEKQPGTFEKRRVNVRIKGRDSSFVDAGVAAGERVVTEGAFLLNAEVDSNAH